MKKEIERKFLFKDDFPKVACRFLSSKQIFQTYLGIGSDDELRVRKIIENGQEQFTFAFKKQHENERTEIEHDISKELYYSTINNQATRPLIKTRAVIEFKGVVFEIDFYKDFDITVVEVEFDSIEAMKQFDPSEFPFLGEEVTKNKEYSNKKLWEKIQS